MSSKTELAYLAGIMDGEGWFSIQKADKGENRSSTYTPNIGVGTSDKVLADWLIVKFGGKLRYRIHHHQLGKKPIHEWRPTWGLIKPIIPKFLPYLVIKGERAKLLLELSGLSSVKFRKGGVPETNMLKREEIYLKIKKLNGYNTRPAAETKRRDTNKVML